jgi:hypothetical protein
VVVKDASTINGDTIHYVIDNLPEKHYDFFVRTYDAKGNVSVPLEVFSTVYGDTYQSGLVNRTLLSSVMDPQGKVVINWGGAATSMGAFLTEMKYMDTSGDLRIKYVEVNETSDTIYDYKPHTKYQYRTLYLPDSLCIDTFYTSFSEVENEELIDYNSIKGIVLASDAPILGNDSLIYLHDGIWNGGGLYASNDNIPLPEWFTLDLGKKVSLSRIRLFQWANASIVYNSSNVKTFQIWGSNDPDPDGGWTHWQQLGTTFNQYKPSGLPQGQHTDEDVNYAIVNGEDFLFPAGMPAVRYIRFKTMETYSMTGQVVLQELSFFGYAAP